MITQDDIYAMDAFSLDAIEVLFKRVTANLEYSANKGACFSANEIVEALDKQVLGELHEMVSDALENMIL